MQILIVAATELEIAPFLNKRPSIDFLITGVGCPATIFHLTKRLQQIDYDLVIQAGIAGTFSDTFQLAEVILVQQDVFADLGISEQDHFHSIFEKGFADENEFPFKDGWLKNDELLLNKFEIPKVKAVTINTVTDNKLITDQLISKYDAHIETMEGAALHYVCLNEHVPFLQVRCISNHVGERDKSKWKMKEAIGHLNDELINIIHKFESQYQ